MANSTYTLANLEKEAKEFACPRNTGGIHFVEKKDFLEKHDLSFENDNPAFIGAVASLFGIPPGIAMAFIHPNPFLYPVALRLVTGSMGYAETRDILYTWNFLNGKEELIICLDKAAKGDREQDQNALLEVLTAMEKCKKICFEFGLEAFHDKISNAIQICLLMMFTSPRRSQYT